ncbi:MAG: hypothetical protein ACE5HJ_03775 [Thermoplasmata archaeon]
MKRPILYVKRAVVSGEECTLYALEGGTAVDGGKVSQTREFMIFASLAEAPDWVRSGEPRVKVLPDEQSLLTFFPLDLLLGESRHASRALDQVTRRLREARTRILCFHPGCRRKARYKGVASIGLEGGCWFACSREHFRPLTTRHLPLREEDYIDLQKVIQGHEFLAD